MSDSHTYHDMSDNHLVIVFVRIVFILESPTYFKKQLLYNVMEFISDCEDTRQRDRQRVLMHRLIAYQAELFCIQKYRYHLHSNLELFDIKNNNVKSLKLLEALITS